MKRYDVLIVLAAVLASIGCTRHYYAKDLKERKVVGFGWLKEMEEYVFNKKGDAERTEKERTFYLACYFDAEMQRGGFVLFFQDIASRTKSEEDADRVIRDTMAALESMEMNDRADVLAEARARYRALKKSAAAGGSDESGIDAMLEKYSAEYYRLSTDDAYYLEGLIEKTGAYVEKSIDEFYINR